MVFLSLYFNRNYCFYANIWNWIDCLKCFHFPMFFFANLQLSLWPFHNIQQQLFHSVYVKKNWKHSCILQVNVQKMWFAFSFSRVKMFETPCWMEVISSIHWLSDRGLNAAPLNLWYHRITIRAARRATG